MTEIRKTHWDIGQDSIKAQVGFSKVDKVNRIVSGFATLDNEDSHDDVVEAAASREAFKRFRGNIREMHQPIAAGRLVDFKEDSYYDPETKKLHKGIYVSAYVSKGAEATWEKVLDGTLSGFSIGGNIKKSETELVKSADGEDGKPIRFIKEYDLIELSLVDNPANQLANVFSIQKSDTGSVIKGMVADVEFVNVFWCENDKLAKNSTSETAECHNCGNLMKNIGWFERAEDEATKVDEIVTKFLRQGEDDAVTSGEGGVNMADENKVDTPAEEAVVVEEVAPEGDTVEKAEAPVEVASEPDFEKLIDDLKSAVTKSLDESKATVEEAVSAVDERVSDLQKSLDENASKVDSVKDELREEFAKSLSEALDNLSERLDSVKSEREDMEKRLDALESATAIKKSSDVEDNEDGTKLQKGFWSGTILS